MSAIIGAIWLDLEEQDERTAVARTKIFNILRHIDSVLADTAQGTLNTADGGTAVIPEGNQGHQLNEEVPHFVIPDVTVREDAITTDTFMLHHLGGNQQDIFGGMLTDLLPLHEMASDTNSYSFNDINGVFSTPRCNLSSITKTTSKTT